MTFSKTLSIRAGWSWLLFGSALCIAGSITQTRLRAADGSADADAKPIISLWADGSAAAGVTAAADGNDPEEHVRVTEAGDHVFSNIHHPSIMVYLPEKELATGAAVLVIPGGGHREIWMDHEGYNVAKWLSAHGIAAFILKYRLAKEPGSKYTVERDSLADAQRAMRTIRHRATEWGVDPARIGVMGFSAGGEIAGLVSMRFDSGLPNAVDAIDRESSKPAFQALIYPGNAQKIIPTPESPPAFLACGYKDRPQISEGLANVYLLFKKAGVPAELHIFAEAGHGFGLRATNHGPSGKWLDRFDEWLETSGFRSAAKTAK